MTQIIPSQERAQMAQVGEDHSLSEVHGEQPPDLERDMWEILTATASAHPDREALVSLWQHAVPGPPESSACLRWTYRDLQYKAEDMACVLESHGCGPRMPLAVILWNCAEWGLLFWAAARIGMTFVPMDPRETNDVLSFMLDAVRPKVLVVQDGETATALSSRNLSSCHARFHCSDQTVGGWMSLSRLRSSDSGPDPRPQIKLNPRVTNNQEPSRAGGSAPALIVFTSGTTGRPKGCLHTNRGLVSQTNAYDVSPDAAQPDRWLVHTPVSHVFAINNALRAWRLGDVVIFPAKCFSVDSTATALVQERCTIMSATPTLVRALLSHSKMPVPPAAASTLSLVSIAGTMIGPQDIRLCREGGLGARDAIQAYGMSEGAPLISWSRQDDMLVDGYHPGVGKALPGTWLRICPPDSIMPLSRTMVGELHVGGPSVISGYLGDVESDKFYNDGAGRWLRTGDQAMMNQDGVVHILGRYKDLIIRGGENINPLMIESVLNKLPGVEAQVIGAPDGIAGQVPVAVVKILPKGIPKAQLMKRARLLGRRYALGGVYTLQELGLENMPLTSLGKPKKAILASLVAKRRSTGKAVERERKRERGAQCQLAHLEETLLAAWEQVTGVRPGKSDDALYLADSITLLRFCDAVLRSCGRQVYLEDLQRGGETVKKLAKLLTSRGDFRPRGCLVDDGDDGKRNDKTPLVGRRDLEPPKPSLDGKMNGNLWESAQALLRRLGLGRGVVEDFVPIRHSMHRMVLGERPQSYHVRIVFRVRSTTPEQIYQSLSKALASRPMMRTMMFCSSQGQPYHAVIGHSEELLDRLIQRTEVESQDEAEELCEDGSMASHPNEFMFKATIISVVEPSREQQALLVMTYNHSIVDALTLLSWHRDVDGLVRDGDDATLSSRTPYRLFADLLSQYEESEPARRSVSFHARRLRGISRYHTTALWPIQRAPGMLISHGDDEHHAAQRQAARMSVWKGTWEARAPNFRFPRRSRVVRLAGLPRLREAHGVEPVVLAMCALAIFNVGQTKSPVALFSSWESGRSWPFVPGWMESRLPPASSIDGPTAQWMLNMTEVRGDETLADFLRRMTAEREQARLHMHAPWEKVVQELREEGRVAVEASSRQSFVWDVSMGLAASRGSLGDLRSLEPVSRYDWPDGGFFWNAFMVDSTNLFFIASWDTAQMNAEEVDECCDALASVMRKLANETNWERTMSEVFAEVRT